jgi:hypothetical protein
MQCKHADSSHPKSSGNKHLLEGKDENVSPQLLVRQQTPCVTVTYRTVISKTVITNKYYKLLRECHSLHNDINLYILLMKLHQWNGTAGPSAT